MKYLLPILVLVASALADVSHLNNEYLPPLGNHHQHHHHQHAEYAAQTNEVPQVIGANTYTPQHLVEPSNSLVPEASQPEPQAIQDQDIRIDFQSAAPAEAVEATQHQEVTYSQEVAAEPEQPAEAVEATQQQAVAFDFAAADVPQAAAQEFVPQTYGSSIIYSNVPEQGPFGVADQQIEQQYEAAASSQSSSSGIDTQYDSNGGYVY